MDKNLLGLLFILAGAAYGALAFDGIYEKTLGWLVRNEWVKPPAPGKANRLLFGRKPTIILYSLTLIGIGFYILLKLD